MLMPPATGESHWVAIVGAAVLTIGIMGAIALIKKHRHD